MAENPPRKLGEDGGAEDYYDSDDDLIMYADGRRMSIQLQKEYHRQVRESEGFDITLDLTLDAAIGAPVIPQRGKENKPKFVDLSQLAIEDFNSQNSCVEEEAPFERFSFLVFIASSFFSWSRMGPSFGRGDVPLFTLRTAVATKYEFVKNVTVNTSYAAGMWCYITFQARDADDTIKTFQALAWWGIDGDRDVKFCRFKKSSK
ncbi:PREDICTED: uncharacterized protein LOC109208780 isoform X1 [Nicotiana attenuata]|uniref:uncharacterized protein LOC109208780 isoform X1 n=1 Tax=Nicotiana attenuata TaxID=49451 RepID=UPI000904CD8E|nr:PREDICTED: uncharacterized protein LOC109208780 isoform X1 [Nicotiana attenuata]XP_019227485.1 PREDICTED: uncharacterized protein LOC109208780 isoform X1 [Nicotiana attenuata]